MDTSRLKSLLLAGDPEFWPALKSATQTSNAFEEFFLLSSLRKKAQARQVERRGEPLRTLRLALLGGYSLYPFSELLNHFLTMEGICLETWEGSFDNYISEIMDDSSGLAAFAPEIVFLMPSEQRCRYTGSLLDPIEIQQAAGREVVRSLLELAKKAHEKTTAEIVMTNFMLPPRHDLGAFRSRVMGSDWSFRKWVNLELGLNAPPFLHICDLEFLAYRLGGLAALDERAWFESKQPGSPALLVEMAREVTHQVVSLRRAAKKVLALDLDNTLWGGVIADDGLEGIELGDTSPRGEAFKAFQKYIRTLQQRGVLLGICSKNDQAKAEQAFLQHPEMVLKLEDIVSFKVNWEPKSDNLRQMASDLNLGLDSFVFVDDNPAEVEIVRQFAPEVTAILLGPDPAEYASHLQDCRLFEVQALTAEDGRRTNQYRSEAQRQEVLTSSTDMASYLKSLEMEATIREINAVDLPRIAQLINKSNQFNLTTRRRTEADLRALVADPGMIGFSVRLKDRFGDHGLISVVIGRLNGGTMEIDTWLMSCRVLKRGVESVVLNELARLSRERKATRLAGLYLATAKNDMVRDFYPEMGFTLIAETDLRREFELALGSFLPILTQIKVVQHSYEPI